MGASTRAAAFTAIRCGLLPRCVDYFSDRDLDSVCPVERLDPAKTWFYTGGFENHPDLVEQISRRHRLWGVGADVLRAVRDPIAVARVLDQAKIPSLDVRLDPRGLPTDGSWLVKPIASGGGRGMEPLTSRSVSSSPSNYYQRRVDGPSFSALFVGRRDGARLVGITRQWIGAAGVPFAYRGSMGPCPMTAVLAQRLKAIGDRFAEAFGLVGWFGVDYVLSEDIPWPVEINPRYTASLEIHELASGRSLLDEHRLACEGITGQPVIPSSVEIPRAPVIAKRILYAERPLVVPEIRVDDRGCDPFELPTIADVPGAGTRVEPGEPIMTLFATGVDEATCCEELERQERSWMRRLESGVATHGPTGLD
jgi:uncharacterized protein